VIIIELHDYNIVRDSPVEVRDLAGGFRGDYPDWAKVGASDSAPSEGEGSTLGGETDNDDLGGCDNDFEY